MCFLSLKVRLRFIRSSSSLFATNTCALVHVVFIIVLFCSWNEIDHYLWSELVRVGCQGHKSKFFFQIGCWLSKICSYKSYKEVLFVKSHIWSIMIGFQSDSTGVSLDDVSHIHPPDFLASYLSDFTEAPVYHIPQSHHFALHILIYFLWLKWRCFN